MEWNPHFRELENDYLFSRVAASVKAFRSKNPHVSVLSMGIGDVSRPLPICVVDAMRRAAWEMGTEGGFRGYPPERGYLFLREAIVRYYRKWGVNLSFEDVFVGDGAKSDAGGLLEIVGDVPLYIPDPVYPVWRDSAILAGKTVKYLPATEDNGFLPMPQGMPDTPCVICLCSPNNPTGEAYTKEMLASWVAYAQATDSLILYDAAYAVFAREAAKSIYEISGALSCAIEIGSFSKMAGFTGVRCSWCVVPHIQDSGGVGPHALWRRRQGTKFNGVGYITARGAEASLSEQGYRGCMDNIAYYRENARMLMRFLKEERAVFYGGVHAPYVWVKVPGGMSSEEAFQKMLSACGVVCTPGSGFGKNGEGWIRLTAFGSHRDTEEAIQRLSRRGLVNSQSHVL